MVDLPVTLWSSARWTSTGVALVDDAEGSEPCGLVLKRGQIHPGLPIIRESLTALDKLPIHIVLIIGEQAVIFIRLACKYQRDQHEQQFKVQTSITPATAF